MSPLLWTWLIGLLVAVVVLALSLAWWVRRSAAPQRMSRGPLPLFSGAQGALWRSRESAPAETFPYAFTPPVSPPADQADRRLIAHDSHEPLPGALEVEQGPGAGSTLGFHHVPNTREDIITFGRSQGPPGRHVQLRDGTVSRRHAQLRFAGGRWEITNFATHNPVRVNAHPLGHGDVRELHDGDLVEMGQTRYRYRADQRPSVHVAKDDIHLVR
jgi:hypothetical protein